MSGPANDIWVLARRTPFLLVAWYLGHQLPLAAGLAFLTYSFFDWFDRNEANNKSISAWVKGERYNQLDIKRAIVNVFDRLYGSPLKGIGGFCRASLVTIIVWALYLIYIAAMAPPRDRVRFFLNPKFIETFPSFLAIWIICDYVSLCVIRRYLEKAFSNPFWSIIKAFLIGICFILLSFFISNIYFTFHFAYQRQQLFTY